MRFQSLAGAWNFRQTDTQDWLPASVPGSVHLDLLALNRIPDPFVGDNEKRVRWVAESDWEYSLHFLPSPDVFCLPHIGLVCDGLDTLASVSLNGHELGKTNNMFRQYRWDVKPYLLSGENTLTITFGSPVQFTVNKQASRSLFGVSQSIPGSPYIRKAPCQFGWDWGPQLPPIGIWKDIRLEGYEGARITDVHLKQRHTEGQVAVEAHLTVDNPDNKPCRASMHIFTPDGQLHNTSRIFNREKNEPLRVLIPNPQLWWPNGYGGQPLYKVVIEINEEDTILDRREYQMGMRTLELRQQPDEWGKSFTFVVNGVPIFVKGSDWIPADSFPTRVTDEFLEKLIKDAVATHQNMLRVWGGGFYEDERFYDLCDKYGILIWQDFVFACSVYPLNDPEFLENLHVEAVENIRRLRHRASLALWCGNNEMEQGWVEWGWKAPEYQDLKAAYDKFFHHILPEWCKAEDPSRAYWPSSPSSNTPFDNPNGQQKGDAHYWDVWHGRKPFTAYRNQYPRFMSEFGFQALPPLPTIRTYVGEDDLNMTSYIMECHQKNDSGNQLMVAQMLDTFQLPKDFSSLVYLSMVLQAEGIRYGVEHWRRYPERVSGILYWQLNDCWPVASWSSLDYFGRWKALHYAARHFYAPLLISIKDTPDSQSVYVTNDALQPWDGTIKMSLEKLDGKVLETSEAPVKVKAAGVTTVCEKDFSSILNEDLRRELVFVADLCKDGQVVSRKTAYFVPTKHLKLANPRISSQVTLDDGQAKIVLTSSSLARLVELSLGDAIVVFSDNYFDLPAGRAATITIPVPEGWSLDQVKAALTIRSVYDSFAHSAD
jgi:beta-mannosidase